MRVDTQRPIDLADQHTSIARFSLNPVVPEAIRVHFETAKNIYLYAWFVYRFYPIAEQQALTCLEFALREYLSEFVERYKAKHRKGQEPGLGALLKHAIQQQIIRNEAFTCRDRWALELARGRYGFEQMQKMMDAKLETMTVDDSGVQASEQDLKHDWLGAFLKFLPDIRNDYAHGSPTLYPTVLRTFEVVMEIINQLYPENPSPSDGLLSSVNGQVAGV
ncbi:MAG: hypothetical protein ACYC05_04475 [Sulfuricella sp.]|nr:hypothetical protein [Gammaproteobacteria bacterium]